MAEKQQNQIIVLEPVTKTVNELLEMITERDQAEIMPFMSADEAVQCTRQFAPCMFVVCIQTNNDIPNILKVLKMLKPDIKSGMVKTLLVSKVKNPQLQKLIGEFGVTDYIEEPITTRSLQFKANLQLRAVDNTRKQIELKKKADEKIVFKTSATNADDTAQTLNGDVKPRNKPALQLANDTFLLKASPVKKQAKKFVVELDGPDPSTGEWVSDGEDETTKTPNWRWKPNEKEDEPGADEGDGWVASGEKPHFKPANKKWQLSSEKPALFYKKKNSKVAEKISTDENGEIAIADDSPMAEENLRKNLAKVERIKKRKAAEAAGLPPPEEEAEEEVKAEAPAAEPEEEEEEKGANAILKALRKKKLAKKKAAEGAAAETAEEEPEGAAESEEEDSPGRKKLEQLRRARKERAAKGLPEELPEEEAEAILAGKPAPEEAPAEEEEDEKSPLQLLKKQKAKPEKPEANVLDFLQKKKGEQKKDAPEEELTSDPEAKAEAEPEAEDESSRTAALLKKARARRARAKAFGLPLEEIEEEIKALKAKAEAEEEAAKEEPAEVPAPEAEEEESSRTAELLKKARERKRQREERKLELLEEIEAEESEAAPEEIEAIERAKKEREAGEAPEEEEAEKPSGSERLEKLRRKREELAALEREEEQEEQGEHLHTAMAEQGRGMNVWDTDEEAIAADEEAKRLKKLKKDRAEKEEKEKAKRGEADDGDPFAELDAEEREAKKKKKGSGTQAEGLEEAFAQTGEDAPAAETEESVGPAGEENPQESVSDRLARLRKTRDERAAQASAKDEAESEQESLTALKEDSESQSEDLLAAADAEQKKDKSAATAGAEEEDLFANADRKEPKDEITLDLAKPEKTEPAPVSAEDLLAQKSKTSESMRKFLERRKQKKEAEQAEDLAAAAKPKMIEEALGPDGKRSFLAIFVAVSDSFGVASDKKMTNILRAIEGSFANCTAYLAAPRVGENRFKVILGNSVEAGAELPAENSHVEDISGESGQVVAHLVIRMSEPRTELAKDEAEAVQRAMLTLRPLASQWLLARGEKAA